MEIKTISMGHEKHHLIEFQNQHLKASILSYGATLVDLQTPDHQGTFESIVMRYPKLEDYFENTKLLGSTVGPYAGRIWPAKLTLNEEVWPLDSLLNRPYLHSERANLARKSFTISDVGEDFVTLKTVHQHLASGYPGTLEVFVTYRFEEDVMTIEYKAHSDQDTYLNLTHHSYFNLSGQLKRDVTSHTLTIPASFVYTLLENGAPGERVEVKGTVFDFQHAKPLKNALETLQSTKIKGLDHPFNLKENQPIILDDPISGRRLSIQTSYESVVVYSNNHLINHLFLPKQKDRYYLGVCLETQHLPNDVNLLSHPPSFLPAKTIKVHQTLYQFSTFNTSSEAS